MGDNLLTSKDILEKTGISRATLNNYIARGFLPKPIVSRPEVSGSGPRQIGHFSPEVLERIELIQQWKRGGISMDDIGVRLAAMSPNPVSALRGTGTEKFSPKNTVPDNVVQLDSSESLTLTVEQLPHIAYMVNYKFEVLWLNEKARSSLPGLFNQLPPGTDDRSIFKLLMDRGDESLLPDYGAMLRLNLTLAKDRMSLEGIMMPLRGMPNSRLRVLEQLYNDAEPARNAVVAELPIRLTGKSNKAVEHSAYATYFREGILIVIAPKSGDADELLRLLGRRDMVIRSLLSKRLPVLTDLAVLVADLQESVKICSELPPDEYFELINKIWATAGEIFRKYYGTYGKHVGDGMVYYFFPQPDSNYVMNAVVCAQELKTAMARISKEWQLRKNWVNELYLNTGLNEGQEWLGTFQTSTSVEFVVLGETINHTARLSDMARFGQIWATKNFMSKLQPDRRDQIDFGIERVGANGQRMMVQSSYSRVGNLVDVESGRYVKLQDIAGLAVTEIRGVSTVVDTGSR
jgi:adenylate cyclase